MPLVQHRSKIRVRRNATVTGSLCGRLNARNSDGMNITDRDTDVTCKFCLSAMARTAAAPINQSESQGAPK